MENDPDRYAGLRGAFKSTVTDLVGNQEHGVASPRCEEAAIIDGECFNCGWRLRGTSPFSTNEGTDGA